MNDNDENRNDKPDMTRRRMLMRLGLAATAVYAAPVMLQLSEAKASSFSAGSRSGPSVSGRRKRLHSDAGHQKPRIGGKRRVTSFSR
jgi:hypothetical protein